MDPVTLAALATGGGNVLSSGINYFSQMETNQDNLRMQRETNAMNSSIAQENRDWNYKMWKEQTAYNSPTEQMSRLKAAGLNPNLVYGQIAESKMSAPPSSPIADMGAAKFEAPKVGDLNPVGAYQQVKNMDALNQVRNADVKTAKAQAENVESNKDYTIWENAELKRRGILKSDSTPVKTLGALNDILKPIGEAIGGYIGRISAERERDRFRPMEVTPRR